MKWGKLIIIFVVILVVTVGLAIIGHAFNDKSELLKYNLIDILTLGIVSIGIYYITELNNDKRRRHDKVENVVTEIVVKLNTILFETPKQSKYTEYLYCFKYVSNKIEVLEKIVTEKEYKIHIEDIRKDFESIRTFVTDNINQPEKYFTDKDRKDKIPNLIINIETALDKIIIGIYEK